MPTLPTNIKVGLYQIKIDLFVTIPLRCFKCRRFGIAKIHVEVVRLASGVVQRDMTSKVAIKIQCTKIARVITCHPQSNVLSGKKKKKFQSLQRKKNYIRRGKKSAFTTVTTKDSSTQAGES